MIRTRSQTTSHAPPRGLGAATALLVALLAVLAACGGGSGASQGVGGATTGPGETMPAATPGY